MKRAYFATKSYDNEYGFGIIAHSLKEAKKIAWNLFEDLDYIDLRVTWRRDALDVQSLSCGEVSQRNGLLYNIYGSAETECDQCKEWDTYWLDNVKDGQIICDQCRGMD